MWNIRKVVSKGDYNYAVVPEHPNATSNGYVLEHRVVLENHLGRLLRAWEEVHHKNENKKDNRPENLEALTSAAHRAKHAVGAFMLKLKCPECSKFFERTYGQTHLGKKAGRKTCYSKTCNGKFSHKMQIRPEPLEVTVAISENIVGIA